MIIGEIANKTTNILWQRYIVPAELGFQYQTRFEEEVYLFIPTLPLFEEVFEKFVSFRCPFINMNKKQDICLALLFNPYFGRLYDKIVVDHCFIPKNRKIFLCRYLLNHFADETNEKVIMQEGVDPEYKQYCLDNDIFEKSRKMIKTLNNSAL